MPVISSGQDLTKFNEGCRLTAYQDGGGVWTIGWGHTGPDILEGLVWPQDKADAFFEVDYHNAEVDARKDAHEFWDVLCEQRRAVLADMAFQIGGHGLSKFVDMLAAMKAEDWNEASRALKDSLLFTEVPMREGRNIEILLTGEWPNV